MLRYTSIVDSLVERFEGVFSEDDIKENGDLPHVFYEHYFAAYIKEKIAEEMLLNPSGKKRIKKSSADEKIDEIFIFLEEMAESEDIEVKNLLQVSVLEALVSDNTVKGELKKYMGSETEKIYNDVLKYLR